MSFCAGATTVRSAEWSSPAEETAGRYVCHGAKVAATCCRSMPPIIGRWNRCCPLPGAVFVAVAQDPQFDHLLHILFGDLDAFEEAIAPSATTMERAKAIGQQLMKVGPCMTSKPRAKQRAALVWFPEAKSHSCRWA